MYLLGLSAFYHDSAAALLKDGEIIAAAQEERFTRKRHDSEFPGYAIEYCLKTANIKLTDLEAIVFYDKPYLKFERLLETYLATVPRGIKSFATAMPVWLKEKLFLKKMLRKDLAQLAGVKTKELPQILFAQHHQSHAASAFFPSPFKNAAVLCLDGVGEWATSTVWQGKENQLQLLWEMDFPHSLGLLYSAFTYFCGFKVNSGEYKLMGLAPYGSPKYVDKILNHLIDLKPDGTFRLNLSYFDFATGLRMTNSRFADLFGGPPRKGESKLTQREMDIARSIQEVTEQIVLRLGRTVHSETGEENLCLAGGVALNCVANGRLLREGPFKNIWIQPAAGDAGGALGAALAAWYEHYENPRVVKSGSNAEDAMKGSYLGPSYNSSEIRAAFDKIGAVYDFIDDSSLSGKVSEILHDQKVVGWFQGRMEFGPRALGARSIIGDARSPKMQATMNLKIKYRESFRPFAPAVLAEEVANYFEFDSVSPYMLMVSPVKKSHQIAMTADQEKLFGIEKLNIPRSTMPAITHVDYSARLQTVHEHTNPRFYSLLKSFHQRSGSPVLVNTSFNVRGEPIVCTPEDAYRCFMRTEMDYLVVENFVLEKTRQPAWHEKGEEWKKDFQLD